MAFMSQSSYNQAVWEFPGESGKTSAAFAHKPNDPDLTVASTAAMYSFCIESIVLRLATISPRDRIIPQSSVLLECRDINCTRVDAGTQQAITKTVTILGSTFKQGIMFTGEVNNCETNQANPMDDETTGLVNLQWSVAGQQLQLPQYDLSASAPVRPYADFLACNGSLYSDRGVGVSVNQTDWCGYPIYMARVVQEPTGAQKECVLRATSVNTSSKMFVIGSHCMTRIGLFYGEGGQVTNVVINQ